MALIKSVVFTKSWSEYGLIAVTKFVSKDSHDTHSEQRFWTADITFRDILIERLFEVSQREAAEKNESEDREKVYWWNSCGIFWAKMIP